MNDQLVEFKTAELAFAKGFDEQCEKIFYEGILTPNNESNCNSLNESNEVSAPTQTALQKWFREEYNIIVASQVNFYNGKSKLGYIYTIDVFNTIDVHDGMDHDIQQMGLVGDKKGFDTYEEALEKAFRKAFKLIK